MLLPKRPATYILTLLLIVFMVIVGWMFHALTSPEIKQAVEKKKKPETGGVREPTPAPPRMELRPVAPVVIDPVHQEKADRLNSPDTTPQQDLQIVEEFIQLYGRAFGGNPIGENADITAALTGNAGQKGRVFPPIHRTIQNGQLTDRWSTPYWFHPNSSSQMEIRSAGPDKQLFTPDDVVLNPSPAGLGATPEVTAP